MIKKIIALLLIVALFTVSALCGCSKSTDTPESKDSTDTSKVETSAEKDPTDGENADLQSEEENSDNQETASESSEGNTTDQGSNQATNNTQGQVHNNTPDNNGGDTADPMKWPDNQYTHLIPKPENGVVEKTGTQNGVYSLMLTGAEQGYAKEYAASLLNAGFTNDVTETVSEGKYLFGGGNASGVFVVVEYSNGKFMIGVQM